MYYRCVLTPEPSCSHEELYHIGDALSSLGWQEDAGRFLFSLPADPYAVDKPAVALGKMLLSLGKRSSFSGKTLEASLVCRCEERLIFSEKLLLHLQEKGELSLHWQNSPAPLFTDLIRLRDAMLTAVQAVARQS